MNFLWPFLSALPKHPVKAVGVSCIYTGHQGGRQGQHWGLPGVPVSSPSCMASLHGASLQWTDRAGYSPVCVDVSAVAKLLEMKYEIYVDVI